MYIARQFADEFVLVTEESGARTLYRKSRIVKDLTSKGLQLLELLLAEPEKTHNRTEILEKIWPHLDGNDDVITTAIHEIRTKALGEKYRHLLATVPGRAADGREGGYRYSGTVVIRKSKTLSEARAFKIEAAAPAPENRISGDDASVAVDESQLNDIVETEFATQPSPETLPNILRPDEVQAANEDFGTWRNFLPRWNQGYQLYATLILGFAVLLLVSAVVWRSLQFREGPVHTQPRVIVRQSREIHSPIVTDGTQLYFPECLNGRFQIGHVNVNATESESTALTPAQKSFDLADISPDGSSLLVREIHFENDSAQFYSQPTDGRPATKLGDIRGLDGTWSRDGNRIYFGDEGVIYVANSDGSNVRLFVDHLSGRPFWLRWSRNGTLRFSLIQGHSNSIWELTEGDHHPRKLDLSGDGGDSWCCGNWDSTGNSYFYQTRVKGVFQIWRRAESSGRLMPFEEQLDDNRGPTLSRNERVIFVRTETRHAELQRFDPDSRKTETLLPQESISTAAVSPDGQWIAYSKFPNRGLYASRLDGTQSRLLTSDNSEAALPVWSPNGSQIAYMTRVHGWWEVYIVSAQGGDAKPLLNIDHVDVRDPNWARDGNKMLIGYGPTIKGKADSELLYIVDVRSRALEQPIPGSEGLFSPRWSPNGKYIAALNKDATKLLIYEPHRGWKTLLENSNFGYPNWSSDSEWIYVLSSTISGNTIQRVRVSDSKAETYIDLRTNQQPCSVFGTWIGMDRDSPLFIKDSSTHRIGAFRYEAP